SREKDRSVLRHHWRSAPAPRVEEVVEAHLDDLLVRVTNLAMGMAIPSSEVVAFRNFEPYLMRRLQAERRRHQISHRKLCLLTLSPQSIFSRGSTSTSNVVPARSFTNEVTSDVSPGESSLRPPSSTTNFSSPTCLILNSEKRANLSNSGPRT